MSSTLESLQGKNVILVCSSHWDREWYWHFQAYREKLVRLLDEITIRLSSKNNLPYYQMDGQFVPIQDYLEVRPEQRERLKELIKNGQLRVGPWYTLPDLFLVSGESLIRNLDMGIQRSLQMGGVSKVGFIPDMFGHNRQMPQIFTSFGLRPAFVWRGLNAGEQPANFAWEGPDGTRIDTYRFGSNVGYAEYAMAVRRAGEPEVPFNFSRAVDDAVKLIEETSERTDAKTILLFDGGDHLEFLPETLALVAELNKRARRELVKIGTLDEYASLIEDDVAARHCVLRGEFRKTARVGEETCLIHGVGSSRIFLKKANHACETLLTVWAEPWATMAEHCLGVAYPHRAFDLAWEYLLQNHPHDSICGCSVDKVHEGMMYRFTQTSEIADAALNQIFRRFTQAIFHSKLSSDEIGVTAFTAAGIEGLNQPDLEFFLPTEWPKFTDEFFEYETKPSFRIFDARGDEVPYQLISVAPKSVYARIHNGKFPYSETRQQVKVCLDYTLKAFSATPFTIRSVKAPIRYAGAKLETDIATLKNEWLEVRAGADGSLELKDLNTGQIYPKLFTFEDSADIGDGWYRGTSLKDRRFISTGCQTRISVQSSGHLQARLQVDLNWELPASFDFNAMERSKTLSLMRLSYEVVLRRDSRWADIWITVENAVKDHRLRVLFPTGLSNLTEYISDSPFDAITRPVGLPKDHHLHRELPVEGTPQQNWIAASDGKRGLAVVAPGQYESAILDLASRPISVTLFRAFSRAYLTLGNEGGQVQGTHRFRMALVPIADVPAASLYHLSQTLAGGMRSAQFEPREEPVAATNLPLDASMWDLRGGAVLSALYSSNQEILLRVYNPSSCARNIQINSVLSMRAWQRVNLDHQAQGSEQVVNDNKFEFALGAWKIQTLRISLPKKIDLQFSENFNQKQNANNKTSFENQVLSA